MKLKAKKAILIALALSCAQQINAQETWKMQNVPIATRWAKEVSPANVHTEYPRPQMQRNTWTNLNGLWEYTITPANAQMPDNYGGSILVPYPIESALSGVKKALQPAELLWYKREFVISETSKNRHILNFGAVDYEATIFVNGKEVGKHTGGYTAFSLDVTDFVHKGSNTLVVRVYDPSGNGVGPHGKQVLEPKDIYYTPSSGIWQTVWLETLPEKHITGITMTPDIDKGILNLSVKGTDAAGTITVLDGGKEILSIALPKANSKTGERSIALKIPNAKLWSPANPFLYDLVIAAGQDQIKSYFGMRKVSVAKDDSGHERIMLNNKPYYNLGTLDQGFWPEGLYTAPTDEALAYDIKAIKAMGFNTIRKHIKIEPARWYYHADKLGMLVWQDFVNPNQGLPEGSKPAFEKQGAEMLAQLQNVPSIVCWVLFNEKWGQYDQARLTSWVKKTDPSRIVNGHSGEFLYVNEKLRSPSPDAYVNADMTDVHAYPDPMNSVAMPGKARVCGEFGGIGVFVPDHQWITGSAWGYINSTPAAFKAKYSVMNAHLALLAKEGLSGSIYTQPFDVEGEQNGIMTYDRAVIKIPFASMRLIHSALNPDAASPSWIAGLGSVTAEDADLTDPAAAYADMVSAYVDGKRDAGFLKKLAMAAVQNKDLAGKARFGGEYMAGFSEPYSAEDLDFISGLTSKVSDKGFAALLARSAADRKVYVQVMNIVFGDVIEPMITAGNSWTDIEAKVAGLNLGLPGTEILMRAKSVEFYNRQDWPNYVTAATAYLEKFGANLSEEERKMFADAVEQHK